MLTVFKNILKFITDPKNTRMLLFGGIVVFVLLFLQQCNKNQQLKEQVKIEQKETQRVRNNYRAAEDSIRTFKVNEDTWRNEKLGYELSLEELQGEYSELLADFEIEKDKPPIVIIKTVTEIVEIITEVPVYVSVDSNGIQQFEFRDTARYNPGNSRTLVGKIPFVIQYKDKNDSTILHQDSVSIYADVFPGNATFELRQEITLNTGLFKDKETGEIMIKVDTKYPGMTFKEITGAYIMDDPDSKKITQGFRKPWSVGVGMGYGLMFSPQDNTIVRGPYIGLNLNYSPKFLQWGK